MGNFFKSKLNILMVVFAGLSFMLLLMQRIHYILLFLSLMFLSLILLIIAIKLTLKFYEVKNKKIDFTNLTPFEKKNAIKRRKNELISLAIEFTCFYFFFIILLWLDISTYIL